MNDVRTADPAARRTAVIVVLSAACVGLLLLLGFDRYEPRVREWILPDPEASVQRAGWTTAAVIGLLLAPVPFFAAYIWWLGETVMRAGEFPPPGMRVVRDTPAIRGEGAVRRGRALKTFAILIAIAAIAIVLVFWRVVSLLDGRVDG